MSIRKAQVSSTETVIDDMRRFAQTGWESAIIEIEGRSAVQIANAVCGAKRRFPDEFAGIKATRRDGVVWLVRCDGR